MPILPPAKPPAVTRDYYQYAATGHYFAVEHLGWQPTKAIGPLSIADLETPIGMVDWTKAVPCEDLNVRFLVRIDAKEMQFLRSGRNRVGKLLRGGGTGPAGMNFLKAGA